MFGKKGRLEKRLAAGELRRAEASVVTTHHLGATDAGSYRVHVRVAPPGEEPFEASLTMKVDIPILAPREGGTLPVAYDPDDRDDVIWDEPTARGAAAQKAAFDRDRRERIAAERREQGLPPVGADDAPDPDLVAKLTALQERKDRGELSDWDFRVARSELFKEKGF